MAYAVGLLATDGCLIGDGRHVVLTSKDQSQLRTFLGCLGSTNAIGSQRGSGGPLFRVQLGDVELYDWLLSIGLTPRKSLTLGALSVPDELLIDLVRGLLDGDGSILNFKAPGSGKANHRREYEVLRVSFASASRRHLEWVQTCLERRLEIRGALTPQPTRLGRNPFFTLVYARAASEILLTAIYADPAAPRLERKWRIWEDYRARHLPIHETDQATTVTSLPAMTSPT